jgi:hypothetical protein
MNKGKYIELHPSKVVKKLTNNKKYTKKDMKNFATWAYINWTGSAEQTLKNWLNLKSVYDAGLKRG